MNAKSCHDLVNQYYKKPVFIEWQPNDWEMRYYTGKTGARRLLKDKAKYDAKRQKSYEKELAAFNEVHSTIDDIATYPKEIANLFLSTFKWTIEDLINRHERHLAHRKYMIETYGEEVVKIISTLKYLVYKTSYQSTWSGRGKRVEVPVEINDEQWTKFTETHYSYTENGHVYPFKDVSDYKKLIEDYRKLKALQEDDDVSIDSAAYSNHIIHMADTLHRIALDINRIFGGNKPTKCETEARWGIDGHFNGILTDGKTRASFLSFSAGGYNIQRYHYRFKITKLK